MAIKHLLALAIAAVAPAFASPVASQAAPGDESLTFNPGGPMKTPTDPPLPFNSGGPVKLSTETDQPSPMSFNPGGSMVTAPPPSPADVSPGEAVSFPTSRDSWLPYNPGGPMNPASPSNPAPSGVNILSPEPAPTFTSKSFPPPPPPPPFPPKHLTTVTVPMGGFVPSCRRMQHKTRPFPPVLPEQTQSVKRPPVNLAVDLPQATTTATPSRNNLPVKGCTTTISQPISNPCEWHGTETIYPSTTTVHQGINCNGCSNIYVHPDIWFCPIMRINTTERVSTPSTYWSTTCLPSTTMSTMTKKEDESAARRPTVTPPPEYKPGAEVLGVREEIANAPGLGVEGVAEGCGCPTTLFVRAPQTAGRTSTCYSRWITTTRQIDCDGCPLVIMTMLQGFGPVAYFTKTTTLPLGTATAYTCQTAS